MRAYDLVAPIVERFGLGDASRVRRLTLTPTSLEVEIYRLNELGKKYIDPVTNEPATTIHMIAVEP